MINRWYEISCDVCSWAQHFVGTVQSAERQYRNNGGIVTRDKKHYCDEKCYSKRAGPEPANKGSE